MDARRGFEPRLLGSEPSVLPLDERAKILVSLAGLEPASLPLSTEEVYHFPLQGLYWSGGRDLNPRPSRWQRVALPLSYLRNFFIFFNSSF